MPTAVAEYNTTDLKGRVLQLAKNRPPTRPHDNSYQYRVQLGEKMSSTDGTGIELISLGACTYKGRLQTVSKYSRQCQLQVQQERLNVQNGIFSRQCLRASTVPTSEA